MNTVVATTIILNIKLFFNVHNKYTNNILNHQIKMEFLFNDTTS